MTRTGDLRFDLVHALTTYDTAQSKRPGYNRHALPIYFEALDDALAYVDKGKPVREALTRCFNGRLLDVCLKAAGLERSTRDEQRGGIYSTR